MSLNYFFVFPRIWITYLFDGSNTALWRQRKRTWVMHYLHKQNLISSANLVPNKYFYQTQWTTGTEVVDTQCYCLDVWWQTLSPEAKLQSSFSSRTRSIVWTWTWELGYLCLRTMWVVNNILYLLYFDSSLYKYQSLPLYDSINTLYTF